MLTRTLFKAVLKPTSSAWKSLSIPISRRQPFASVANPNTNTNTRVTTLSNGLKVATENIPHSQTATVGVWIDAGSRAETEKDNGAAHFLEHMAFKGTKGRTQWGLEMEVENMGSHLNAYTSREQTVYYAKSFKNDIPKAVDILSDILQNSKLDVRAIERERDVILREQKEVEKQTEEVVFDHLHAVAFKGNSLGLTILGPESNIRTLSRQDLSNYISKNYTADRMVVAAAGGVDHEVLVEHARKAFGHLRNGHGAHRAVDVPRPKFVGAEARLHDETMPQAHIALAVEGVGWNSPDYYTMLVLQTMIGSWDRTFGAPENQFDRLSFAAARDNLCNSYMSFNTAYTDTGLFGMYLISENTESFDRLIHHSIKEWSRLTAPEGVVEEEVERAKKQLKASLLLGLDGTTAIAEDIGRQMVTGGRHVQPEEVAALVEKVTPEDVRMAAVKYLKNKDVAVVGMGRVTGLPEHHLINAAMYDKPLVA